MLRSCGEENELVICPYDKSHHIRKLRMQVHLIRCRRNHLTKGMATCPFNDTHLVNKLELDDHVKICPERKSFELFRHQDIAVTNQSLEDGASSNTVGSEDLDSSFKFEASAHSANNWDVVPDTPTYNPAEYAQNAHVLREPQGMNRSERRQFRGNERNRLLGENNDLKKNGEHPKRDM